MKTYKLLGADGKSYTSTTPGTFGGHRKNRGYGRLDCPSALRWIAKGYYVKHRVFFADELTAVAAGYRPCASCLPEHYALWKRAVQQTKTTADASVYAIMQADGNLCIYPGPDPDHRTGPAIWASGTNGAPGKYTLQLANLCLQIRKEDGSSMVIGGGM